MLPRSPPRQRMPPVTPKATGCSFSAQVLSPSRLQASFFYSREDRARFSGMDSKRCDMNLVRCARPMRSTRQILVGTNGLLTGTVLSNHNVTAATTYANYRDLVRLWPGRWHLRRGSWRHQDRHAEARYLRPCVGCVPLRQRWRPCGTRRPDVRHWRCEGVSAHVPDPASSAVRTRSSAGVRVRDMVAPIWEGDDVDS